LVKVAVEAVVLVREELVVVVASRVPMEISRVAVGASRVAVEVTRVAVEVTPRVSPAWISQRGLATAPTASLSTRFPLELGA
jgi:hypothetical protein